MIGDGRARKKAPIRRFTFGFPTRPVARTFPVAFPRKLRLLSSVKTVERWSQIPEFEDEREEAVFWSSHGLDPRLMNASIQRQTVRESTTITLRFDPQMLSRIKRIARQRYLNYQSMIKHWLAERLEEEVAKQAERSPDRNQD